MAKKVTKKVNNSNELDGKEFFAAIAQIEKEKGIKPGYMMEKITQALLSAYRRDHEGVGENLVIEANEETATVRMFLKKDIVEVVDNPGTEISLGELHFRAVFAAHSDREAIGVVITGDGKRVYHMGDSLYHRHIFADPVEDIDLLILPINGKGNNMNAVDAARMTRDLAPNRVLPMHWDLFKAFGCDVTGFTSRFSEKDAVEILIPQHYEYFTI